MFYVGLGIGVFLGTILGICIIGLLVGGKDKAFGEIDFP